MQLQNCLRLCGYYSIIHRQVSLAKTLLCGQNVFMFRIISTSRSQWPSGLRRGSASHRLLRLRVRIPPGAWMFVLCELHSKDKRHSQDKRSSTDEVQTKKFRRGMDVCVVL